MLVSVWLLGCLGCKTGWPISPQMLSGTIAVILVIRFAVDLHWHSDAVDAPRNMGVASFVGGLRHWNLTKYSNPFLCTTKYESGNAPGMIWLVSEPFLSNSLFCFLLFLLLNISSGSASPILLVLISLCASCCELLICETLGCLRGYMAGCRRSNGATVVYELTCCTSPFFAGSCSKNLLLYTSTSGLLCMLCWTVPCV